jgi:hypothetical protein
MHLSLGALSRIVLLLRDFERSARFCESVPRFALIERRAGWAAFDIGDVLHCLRGAGLDALSQLELGTLGPEPLAAAGLSGGPSPISAA